ncbi:MAG: tol-pal system protein YbgF [Acidobacteriota bacterium]
MKKIVYLLLIFLIPFMVGAKKKEYQILMEEIQKLQERVSILEKKVDSTANEILQIYTQVKTMSEQLKFLQKSVLEFKENSDVGMQKISTLNDKITELTSTLSRIYEEVQKEKTEVRDVTPEKQGKIGEEKFVYSQPQQIYYTAYSDYIKGNYSLAIAGFRQYLEKFKDSPDADNAQYWIGECYYSQKDHENAIKEFDILISTYPKADKIPSAYLKKGYAFLELMRIDEGKKILRDLISKFPFSEEAKLAEEKLRRIGQ